MSLEHRLLAASGYLDLGMLADAAAELAALSPEERARPDVMGLRVDIHMAAKEWAAGAELAGRLVQDDPGTPGWWINYAYCTRRAVSVERAEEILLEAAQRHPQEAMIRYNLACYASVTGRIEEARSRLNDAIALDPRVKKLAQDDEDLASLHPIRS